MSRRSTLRGSLAGTRFKILLLATGTLLAISFALIWSSQSSSAATQGPVAAWSFDENTGETVEDLYGEADGTVEHAEWKKGVYGSALEFDGKESCVTVPNGPQFQMGEEFTVEAWVRPNSAKEFAPVFFKEDPERDYGYVLMAGGAEGGHPSGYINDGTYPGPEIEATAELPIHVWSHLALTFDGAHVRLYVNGALVASGASNAPVESKGSLRIGCGDNYGYWDYFDGRIDEPRVYERALSAPEIAADMQAPLATPKAGPVAEWSFDAVSEGTVEDHAGKNEGTVEGAKLTEPSQGRYGPALEFDGKESCVKVPNSGSLQLSEEFTVEAWIRPEGPMVEDPIIFKEDEGGGGSYWLGLGFSEAGKPQGWAEESLVSAPEAIPDDVWTHVAFTYDGDRLHILVDGELVASHTVGPMTLGSTGPLYIGCAGNWEDWFKGRIDEPRIYERALSAAEVAADMETPIQTPKAGPIAAYSFDEGEPGDETVEDVTGHGHTATIEGEAKWAKGKYGGALSFLKEGDCASVADSPELRLTEEFTLEAWVRPDGGIYEDPVVVREAGGKDVFGLGIGTREEGKAEAFIGEGAGSKAAVGGSEIRPHEWVHLAATWDGAKIRLYVDGELAATKATTTPPGTGEGALRIGCDAPEGPFDGRIDEVRVYGRTLNGPEIAADMETPLQTPKATPVAAYSFDEKNEETAADTTGDGHTATVEGAKWTEHGRYGGALEFDAAKEDVLKIPASPELNFGEEFTLEAWVRPSGEDNKDAPLIDKQEGSGLGYSLYEGGTVSDRPVGAVAEGQEHVHADDPLPAHAWSHVALTFTGDRTYLYVNGELVDNGAAEPVVTSEGELEIGGSTDTGEYFDGRIDEVRVYNRGLDAAEVAADMEASIQTPKRGPVAAWSFDGARGEGETFEDLSGFGHTASVEGASTAPGRYGDALNFDAEDDCVSVAESEDLRFDEEFSLEAWVRPGPSTPGAEPIIAQEDEGYVEGEEPYAYMLLAGGEEPPEGRIRITGEHEYAGISGDEALPRDVWSHIALTDDGAHMRLYQDGSLVSTVAAPVLTTSHGRLSIGCDKVSGAEFEGRIDEVRVYNRSLTAPEVLGDMRAPLDKLPPEIELSGALTEGLRTGITEYPLEITATDHHGSGVRRIVVQVDGTTKARFGQHCTSSECSEHKTWTFDSSAEPGPHQVVVSAEDSVGNTSVRYLGLAEPSGAFPACNPLDPGSTSSTPESTETIEGGAVVSKYQTANGKEFEIVTPPAGFDPGTATDGELAAYGFPNRPSEAKAAEEWEEQFAEASPVSPNICHYIGEPHRNETSTVGAETFRSAIWSGFEAFNSARKDNWKAIRGRFNVPIHREPWCPRGDASEWVGIGGDLSDGWKGGLIQAGVDEPIGGEGKPYMWVESIRKNPSEEPKKAEEEEEFPLPFPVARGDRVESYVSYNKSAKRAEIFLDDLDNKHFYYPPIRIRLGEAEYFDGTSAEFVDERDTIGRNPVELQDFGNDPWTHAEVKTLSGEWSVIGHVTRHRLIMQPQESRPALAEPSALGPNKSGFVDKWKQCHA